MIAYICLIWVGIKLAAPTWYFVITIVALALRLIEDAKKLFEGA